MLDGAAHGCWLPDDEPPEPGQERMLGDVMARDVTKSPDGHGVILASRL
jgi:hypothetical protein